MAQQPFLSEKNLVWLCYGLYALSLVTGGIAAIVAVIINYLKRNELQDPLCKRHMEWQIATFWHVLMASVAVLILSFLLTITVILSFLTFILWFIPGIWFIYRIVKGALAFNDRKMV